MYRIVTIAIASILAGGCTGGRNDICEWPPGTGASLTADVQLAEDLAVRYADAQGYREGWRSEREACEAKLFQMIATRHNSTLAEIARIRDAFSRRGPDLPVYGPMLGLCALAAWWLVGSVMRRFGDSEPVPRMLAVVVGTVLLAVMIIGIGQVWAGLVETIRIGNGHLSYRASRIPWAHHRVSTGISVAVVVLFTLWLYPRRSAG